MISKLAAPLRIDRIRVPIAVLFAVLQRTPALRIAASAADSVLESPMGSLLKAAAASIAALGAVDSVAGATTYTLTTGSPGHPSPYTVTENSQIIGVAFGLNPEPEAAPQSWTVTGSIPPGLTFGTSADSISSPGTVNVAIPTLTGTPTAPGDYVMMLTAWEGPNATIMSTNTFDYEVIVTAGMTPTPTPTPSPTPTPTPTPTQVATNAPAFTTQPLSVNITGGTVALDAVATNSPSYQWYENGTKVSGATDSILLLSNGAASLGSYTCVATNSAGSATSSAASVTLSTSTVFPRLTSLSCRALVGTGANIIFGGFVVGPSGTSGNEPLLIRGSGPALALAPFNLTGTLPDPELTLNNLTTGTVVGTPNNGWGGSVAISNAASAVGAFPWSVPTSHDAALLESLPLGNYTAEISGQSGDSGVSLVEIYDTTPGTYVTSMPRLVALSARVFAGSGSNGVFAGFSIPGFTAKTVLIRASGPALALAPFNLPNTLPDPQLTLTNITVSPSVVVTTNTVWGGDVEIMSTAASVGAFPWGSNSRDSALLITLPPGNYTAGVAGASGDTGVALVEVYEVL